MSRFKIYTGILMGLLTLALFVFAVVILFYVQNPFIICGIVVGFYSLSIIFAFIVINSNRINYSKASWILVFLVLPGLSVALFFFYGINPLHKKKWINFHGRQKELLDKQDYSFTDQYLKSDVDPTIKSIYQYGVKHSLHPISNDNKIDFIEDNTELLIKSIELVKQAKHSINIQSYIFSDRGFWSRILFTELAKKVREGVKVRLMYDWWGIKKKMKEKDLIKLKKYGIEMASFNPKGLSVLKGSTNYRIHSKYLIIDNKYALYGGSNFSDEYLSMDLNSFHWKDFNMIISGSVVNTMNIIFCSYWTTFTGRSLSWYDTQNIRNDWDWMLKKKKTEDNTVCQFVSFNPDFNEYHWKNFLINSFHNSQKSIKMVTPYICISVDLINALLLAKKRGVDIELVVHCKNQKLMQLMNRGNYLKLINAGIKVYEYDGYLHAKYFLIDNNLLLTGSCNLDYRSMYLNFESEIIVHDKQLVKTMNSFFDKTKVNAKAIDSLFLQEYFTIKNRFLLSFLNIGKTLF